DPLHHERVDLRDRVVDGGAAGGRDRRIAGYRLRGPVLPACLEQLVHQQRGEIAKMLLGQRNVVLVERPAKNVLDLAREVYAWLALNRRELESGVDRGLHQEPRGLERGLVELRLGSRVTPLCGDGERRPLLPARVKRGDPGLGRILSVAAA